MCYCAIDLVWLVLLSVYLVNVLVIEVRSVNKVYFTPDLKDTPSILRVYLLYQVVLIVVILISIQLFV
jgi:hypothetical protein